MLLLKLFSKNELPTKKSLTRPPPVSFPAPDDKTQPKISVRMPPGGKYNAKKILTQALDTDLQG